MNSNYNRSLTCKYYEIMKLTLEDIKYEVNQIIDEGER